MLLLLMLASIVSVLAIRKSRQQKHSFQVADAGKFINFVNVHVEDPADKANRYLRQLHLAFSLEFKYFVRELIPFEKR